MVSARAWRPSGVATRSHAAARRGASVSRFSCRASTPAPDSAGDAAQGSLRYPRHQRLTRGPDIRTVAQEGKRIRTAHLEVRALASPLGISRVGLIVPRHRHTAVARNRLKRRLRELVRTQMLPSAPPADVLIRARREAYDASFELLAADIARAASQLERLFRS